MSEEITPKAFSALFVLIVFIPNERRRTPQFRGDSSGGLAIYRRLRLSRLWNRVQEGIKVRLSLLLYFSFD